MRILQTIGGFGAKSGGTSTCTYDLLSAIHQIDDVSITDLLTPDVVDSDDTLMGVGESWIKTVSNDYKSPLALSKNMENFIKKSEYDIYHTNGMWMHINHITCTYARKKGKPYVITPHGMLYPQTLSRSYWKKWPMLRIWFNKDLHEASCIHATCDEEMTHLRNFGYCGPISVIANPIFVPEYTEQILEAKAKNNKINDKIKIGFLGRLHPRKKVHHLIQALNIVNNKNIELVIIGDGSSEYKSQLTEEVHRLGLTDRVQFLGFLNGFDKYAQLGLIDCLFVPSDMENFGMIVPEALLVGTPVMASLGTPWKVLNDERLGWWTDNAPESIAKVIDYLATMADEQRLEMGKRGREYILRTFAADKIATKMLNLYRWLLGETEKPDFVYTL